MPVSLDVALLAGVLALGWGRCALRARRAAAARQGYQQVSRLSASLQDLQARVEKEAATLRELEASAAKLRAQTDAEKAELAVLQEAVTRAQQMEDTARSLTITGPSWRRR